jgi:hypothetical protein
MQVPSCSEDAIAEKDGGAGGVLRLLNLVMIENTAAPRQGVRPASRSGRPRSANSNLTNERTAQ